jgi:hypothetical protein
MHDFYIGIFSFMLRLQLVQVIYIIFTDNESINNDRADNINNHIFFLDRTTTLFTSLDFIYFCKILINERPWNQSQLCNGRNLRERHLLKSLDFCWHNQSLYFLSFPMPYIMISWMTC